jgi:hypothetical protein
MRNMIQTILVATVSVVLMVACNKKGGDSAPQPPPVPLQPTCVMGQVTAPGMLCVNGLLIPNPAGTGDLLNNVEFTTSYMSGNVSLGSMGGAQNVNQYGQELIFTYSGQVNVSGTIQVLSNSLCGAPIGGYSVQGTGNIWSGSMNNLTLTISGPANMNLMIYSAVVTNPNGLQRDGAGNRLGILGAMLTVNGVPCGSVVAY